VCPPRAVGFLGLDVSHAEVVACLLGPDGAELTRRWTVPNTQSGAEALATRVAALAGEAQLAEVRIGMEATGLYWWHLACLLRQTPLLAAVPHAVYVLNPALVAGLKRVYPRTGKTDRRDAFFIAERVRLGRLPAPFQVDLLYAPLQRLTRFRVHLAQSLAREKSYFLSFLFLQCSTYTQERPFGDPFGATSMTILEQNSLEELVQWPAEQLAAYLQAQGHGRFADPDKVATTLAKAARDAYRLDRLLAEPVSLVLATTLATIRTLQGQLTAVDRTIERELLTLPEARRTIRSIPGLGPVWTAGLVAEIGAIERFADDGAVAKYAGLVWEPAESGQFHAQDTAMSKAGNTYLRYYLVEGANSVRQHCPEYQAYYAAKLAQSTKHGHQRALVLSARKLVRLIDALLRAGAVYVEQDRKEGQSTPHAARPGPQRRARLASAAS
jgi:transposase